MSLRSRLGRCAEHSRLRYRPHVLLAGVMLAASSLAPVARADIYVWSDAIGVTHVSNLPPPEGTRDVSVTRARPRDAAQETAAREAARLAEVRALDQRIRELEAEAEHTRREASRVVEAALPLPALPAPAPVVIVVAPPSPPAPAYAAGPCDFGWSSCGWNPWPAFYAPGVVVLREGRPHPPRRPLHAHRPPHAAPFPAPELVRPSPKPVHWRK